MNEGITEGGKRGREGKRKGGRQGWRQEGRGWHWLQEGRMPEEQLEGVTEKSAEHPGVHMTASRAQKGRPEGAAIR